MMALRPGPYLAFVLVGLATYCGYGGAATAQSIAPYSLMGDVSGVSPNAAHTVDVSSNLADVLEHERLIDANGVTACDKYFGWGGVQKSQTEAQKLLCGKYQFLYEHWGAAGIPRKILEFNERWFPKFVGDKFKKLGYFENTTPTRVVTDVKPISAGQCLQKERKCGWNWLKYECKDVCTKVAPENSWAEQYSMTSSLELPLGLQVGPKKTYGFESAVFTCASCHVGRLPDGRVAIGMDNSNLNYGQFLTGLSAPMQGTLAALTNLLEDPVVADALDALIDVVPQVESLFGTLNSLKMHPGLMFNDPSTEYGLVGPALVEMMQDLKQGTCYFKPNGERIRCDHNHISHGPPENNQRAAEMLARLQKLYGNVYTKDWNMAMREIYGDTYCVPWPFEPSDFGGIDQTDWGQFYVHALPSNTVDSMKNNCDGLRWNADYWKDFVQLMVSMASGDVGSLAFPGLSEQDLFINSDFSVMDFLTGPMTDEVLALSKVPTLVGIPDASTLAAHPTMRTEGGRPTQLLSLSGGGVSLEQFAAGFVLLSGSVDPRYVECTDPGIVGNWEAVPNESCKVKAAAVAPLVAYIQSLRTPYIAGSVTAQVQHGQQLFEANCQSCHAGPSGQTDGVFVFGELQHEGLAQLELCDPEQHPVEWTNEIPPKPLYNECRPIYSDVSASTPAEDDIARYLGIIGTDPNYSKVAQPDPATGMGMLNPELAVLGKITQAVKGQRLAGVRYKSELMHHGQLHSLDDVLCRPGTHRASPEQRAESRCMAYDLETDAGIKAYKAGQGICLQTWQPYRGHEFGCGLSESDKDDLISYLGTL